MVGRTASILARRALFLTIALVLIMILTAVIIGASGYDVQVLRAIIGSELQAYRQSLQRQNIPAIEIQKLVEQRKQELIRLYGLNKPWEERVLPMAWRALKLDLGYVRSQAVANVVGQQLPLTVKDAILTVLPRTLVMLTVAELICAAIALKLAPLIAYKRGSLLDKAVIAYAAFTNALPLWWLAIIALFVFGYELHIAPTNYHIIIKYINEFTSNPLAAIKGIIEVSWLPVTVIVIGILGGWLYGIRAIAIRVVNEDYVYVAKAKGVPEDLVVKRYILRVILGPVLTIVILALAGSIGGIIITESVFNWPGMGSLYYAAIVSGDAPTLLGLVYITTLVYILARFLLEVIYILVDPRVRY